MSSSAAPSPRLAARRILPPAGSFGGLPDRLWLSDLRFVVWVVLPALFIALTAATEKWQLALTFTFVLTAAALYTRWPTAGIAVLFVLWSCAPVFRRLLDYFAYSSAPDLLSLAPYLATAVLGMLAYRRAGASGPPLVVLALVAGGLLIGAPRGLQDPLPLIYGMFAYGSASLALLVGYADWRRGRLVVERILLALLPLIAAYGLYQYFAPTLPPWDELWLETSKFVTAGSKETGDFKFFSVLNSPGTLASLLSLLIVIILVARRLTPVRLLGIAAALTCVALIGIRSAWVMLAAALAAITLLSPGRMLPRVLVVALVLGALYVVAGGSGAGDRVTQRAATLTNLSQDTSYRARIDQVTHYGPQAAAAPLGHGLGSVGQASKLSKRGQGPFEDNGYLLLLWQVGPIGFLVVAGGALYGIAYGVRRTADRSHPERLSLIAPLVAIGVLNVSGESFYGLSAVLFWYSLGALLAAARVQPEDETEFGPARPPGGERSLNAREEGAL